MYDQDVGSKLITREPSSRLFSFTEFVLSTWHIQSILPEAQFFLSNITKLNCPYENNTPILELARTIDLFEKVNHKLDFVSIKLPNISKECDLLSKHRIRELLLWLDKLDLNTMCHAKGCFDFLTDLVSSGNFMTNELDAIMFEFCERTLVNLKIKPLSRKIPDTILEKSLFKRLLNLSELEICHAHFDDQDIGDYFVGLGKLTQLSLHSSKIDTVRTDAFRTLTNLASLSLDYCKITEIEPDAFNGMSKLTQLSLSHFSLTNLNVGIFNGLENLKSLNLSDSDNLSEIETGVFYGLSNLIHLNLSRSRVTKMKSGTFHGLNKLEELDLHESREFVEIESETFAGLSSLKKLDMSMTGLRVIPSKAFSQMTKLRFLNMSHSRIEFIHPDAFDGITNMEELSLESSFVKLALFELKCSPRVLNFAGTKGIESFKLTGDDISRIQEISLRCVKSTNFDFTFDKTKHFNNLSRLELNIQTLGNNLLGNLRNLKELRLSQSEIVSGVEISNEAFRGLDRLKTLELMVGPFEPAGTLLRKGILNDLPSLENLKITPCNSCICKIIFNLFIL
jgi:Leucine-rich repeat (LRR) protein